MKRPEQPCKSDCAGRRIGCHAMCDEYSDYEFKRQLWYDYVADIAKKRNLPISLIVTAQEKQRKRRRVRR